MGGDDLGGDDFRVRAMKPEEVALAVDWAAAEGWNPGLADADCFASAGPGGFLVGEFQGKPAATVSVVNHDTRLSFLGFYIVRAELRGRGFGWRTWQAGIERAGQRSIGLDGVVAQQDNYRKSGFDFAYNNVRYGGVPAGLRGGEATVPLRDVPFEAIARDDAAVFPADRPAFVRGWIEARGAHRPRADAKRQARGLGRDPALLPRPQGRTLGGGGPRGGRSGSCSPDRG